MLQSSRICKNITQNARYRLDCQGNYGEEYRFGVYSARVFSFVIPLQDRHVALCAPRDDWRGVWLAMGCGGGVMFGGVGFLYSILCFILEFISFMRSLYEG
jgi:hypothetical protein